MRNSLVSRSWRLVVLGCVVLVPFVLYVLNRAVPEPRWQTIWTGNPDAPFFPPSHAKGPEFSGSHGKKTAPNDACLLTDGLAYADGFEAVGIFRKGRTDWFPLSKIGVADYNYRGLHAAGENVVVEVTDRFHMLDPKTRAWKRLSPSVFAVGDSDDARLIYWLDKDGTVRQGSVDDLSKGRSGQKITMAPSLVRGAYDNVTLVWAPRWNSLIYSQFGSVWVYRAQAWKQILGDQGGCIDPVNGCVWMADRWPFGLPGDGYSCVRFDGRYVSLDRYERYPASSWTPPIPADRLKAILGP